MTENGVLLGFALSSAATGLGTLVFFRKAPTHGKSTAKLLIAGNLLVLAFLCSLAVLAGELYFRVVYDSTDSFGLTKTTQRWFARHFRYNAAGLRDSVEYRLKRTSQARRITFLGDSFTVGHGIANVEDRFANRIRASMPSAEVHVLAHPGLDTGAETALLLELATSGYQLDDVLLVYGLNDISDIVPQWREILQRIYDAPKPGVLVENSYLFNWLYFRWFAARDPDVSSYFGFVRDNYDGPVWELQQTRLARLQREVEKRGGRLLVVTFPFLHRLGPDYDYRAIHDKLAAMWKARSVPHLDLLDIFRSMSPDELVVGRFDAHPNEHAHALASAAIAAFIKDNAARPTEK